MKTQESPAVTVALAHIVAWSSHDWEKTKELLAPDVHAVVTTAQPQIGEYTGTDEYMAIKVKAAKLIEPGSLEVLSAIGDENNALIMVTFRIGMGPAGAMVTMARTGLYLLDENKKIKEERDSFFLFSENLTESPKKDDFRAPTKARKSPRAVADAKRGIVIAVADLACSPEQAFNALTTKEVEQWWKWEGQYKQKDWKSDVRIGGAWSVTVELVDGNLVHAWGEFCDINFPSKLVMTRRFDAHPFLGERETTISYEFEPTPEGTLVTVRDEGFIGRSEAAYGNAEIWEHVLGWLDGFMHKKNGQVA